MNQYIVKSVLIVLLLIQYICLFPQDSIRNHEEPKTHFIFGGYAKYDAIFSVFQNGDVPSNSPLRDFHLPSAIPVGEKLSYYDTHMHVKESRINFDVSSHVLGKKARGFVELDFLLSQAGDERISNSYNPRMREFYVEWGKFLFGQSWTTFMILIIPEDLDFTGAAEGLVFGRQPQFRFTAGSWQFAIENTEMIKYPYQGGSYIVESGDFPDFVARKNFKAKWGQISVAGLWRGLHHWTDSTTRYRSQGFGITTGGKVLVGKRDDIRFMATYGKGLGRYIGLGFISSSVLDEEGRPIAIESINGYIAYLHYWNKNWASSVNFSALQADNDINLSGPMINKMAWSVSGNLLHYFSTNLMMGIEFMRTYRELEGGDNGEMHRLQFSVKYTFQKSVFTKKP